MEGWKPDTTEKLMPLLIFILVLIKPIEYIINKGAYRSQDRIRFYRDKDPRTTPAMRIVRPATANPA